MYNYSRLCQVLAVYEKKCLDNYYYILPDIKDINFDLLQKTVSVVVLEYI